MRRHRVGTALAVAALTTVALAVRRWVGPMEAGTRFPGAPVVLISIDTLRSDRLPAYGYAAGSTPAIDGLTRDAILFERAYSHVPLTLPSHLSLFTGLLPPSHGVRDNAGYHFDAARHPALAGLLRDAGYETAAAVSSYVLRAATGVDAGFDEFDDRFRPRDGQSLDAVQRPGVEAVRAALSWVRSRATRRFFVFVHLYEPHAPYRPPSPFAERLADPYDGEVAAADAAVGELLDGLRSLGVYDRALIVLLSDHGEALGDHGGQTHGVFLYREALQVPLIVKLPGAGQAGRRVSEVARLVDVLPTILAVTGNPASPPGDGANLLQLLDGSAPPRTAYAETWYPRLHFGWSETRSWIEGAFHYIEAPQPELFDLEHDPAEVTNLAAAERRVAARLRHSLQAIDGRFQAPSEIDPEARRQLAALGYLGSASAANPAGPLPDPKSQMATVRRLEAAWSALDRGELEASIESFRQLVADHRGMTDAWFSLATALQRLRRHREAVEAFDGAMAAAADPRQFALAAAGSLLALGRFDEALSRLELAQAIDPGATADLRMQIELAQGDLAEAREVLERASALGLPVDDLRRRLALGLVGAGQPDAALLELSRVRVAEEPENVRALALALAATGRPAAAAERLRSTLAAHPRDAESLEVLAVIESEAGNEAAAEDALRRAIEIDAVRSSSWALQGQLRWGRGDVAGAREAWRRAVELDPMQLEALFNLALVSLEQGEREEGRRLLERFLAAAPESGFGEARRQAKEALQRCAANCSHTD